MHTRKRGGALLAAFAFALLLAGSRAASAQEEGGDAARRQSARPEINFEVQLQLLVTAEGAEALAKPPQSLDGVLRQLRASVPASDYRLAATFFSRVRNGGTVESSSSGNSAPPGAAQGVPMPTFYQYAVSDVRVAEGGEGFVQIRPFRFGARLPYQPAQQGGPISYQDTGLVTQTSVREGEPTLVGTLNTTRPGQVYALVLTVRRAAK